MKPVCAIVCLAAAVAVVQAGVNQVLANGLAMRTIQEGRSCARRAQAGDRLSVHYVGRLGNENGKIFDASRNRGSTFDFTLGSGQVIQGYDLGVPGMCIGETRVLVVPPTLGYGAQGVSGVIPGGATLHFTIELMSINGRSEL